MADKIQGITVEIGGDTTGLSAALKDINKESSSLSKELRDVEKLLKLDPTNTELLAQKEELLAKQAETAAKRVDAVHQAQDQFNKMVAEGKIEKGTEEYRKFEREVAGAEASLKKAKDAQEEFGNKSSAISKVKDAVAGVKGKLDELKDSKFGQAVSAGFDTIKSAAKATVEAVAAVGAATAAGIAAGAKVIADTTTQAAVYADNFATLSTTTGVAVETLQAYAAVSELVDVSTETLTGSMTKNFAAMQKAAEGNESYAAAYEALGVTVTDENGKLRDSETVYWELIDALGNVEDETERDALAMTLFGKSAKDLNPLIETGTEALHGMMEEAKASGAVLSEDTLNSLLGVSDTMEQMKTGAEAVQNNFGALGATLMTEVYGGVAEVEKAFTAMIAAAANGEEITDEMKENFTQSIVDLVRGVAEALPALLEALGEIFEAALEAIGEALPMISATLIEYLPQLTDTILSFLPTLLQVGLELFVALIGALPEIIKQICAAIPEIITAIVDALLSDEMITQIINSGVELLIALVENLPQIIKSIVSAIPRIITALVTAFMDNKDKIKEVGSNLIQGLVQGIQDMAAWVKEKISGFFGGVVDSIKDFFGIHSPSRLFRDEIGRMLALGVGEGFTDEMRDVREEMEDALPTRFDTEVNTAFGAVNGGIGDVFDVTIPFMIGADKITTAVSRIQYSRQAGQARVLGVSMA